MHTKFIREYLPLCASRTRMVAKYSTPQTDATTVRMKWRRLLEKCACIFYVLGSWFL